MVPDGRVLAALGDRKTGKSWHARERLLRPFAAPGRLAIYVTPNGAATDPLTYGREMTVAQARRATRLPAAICFRGEEIDEVCEWAEAQADKFEVGLCIDEAHEVFPENFSTASPAGRLFHRGRHIGITLIVVSQWPARLDKRLFRAASEVYWFRLHAREDLHWVAQRWGKQASQDLAALEMRRFIVVHDDDLPDGWRAWGTTPSANSESRFEGLRPKEYEDPNDER